MGNLLVLGVFFGSIDLGWNRLEILSLDLSGTTYFDFGRNWLDLFLIWVELVGNIDVGWNYL